MPSTHLLGPGTRFLVQCSRIEAHRSMSLLWDSSQQGTSVANSAEEQICPQISKVERWRAQCCSTIRSKYAPRCSSQFGFYFRSCHLINKGSENT